jgi:hypothetical protein
MNALLELLKKRLQIRKIYISGIGQGFFLLRFYLPFISTFGFIFILKLLNLSVSDTIDLTKQLNSLVGIILGFSIASFAIFISISNDKLESISKSSKYTYRQIGSSLFFYSVEMAVFTSLIGILLVYLQIPQINLINIFQIKNSIYDISLFSPVALKFYFFIVYIFMFFQLVFNLFFSSLFLNSSIKR